MGAKNSLTGIRSIEDVLEVLRSQQRAVRAARQLVISSPDRNTSRQILRACIAQVGRSLVLSLGQHAETISDTEHVFLPLRSPREALRRCRNAFRRAQKESSIFIETSEKLPSRQHALLSSLIKLSSSRQSLTVWCVSRDVMAHDHIALLKDAADLFLDIHQEGKQYVAQFHSAKNFYVPDFFLPRRLTITSDSTRLSRTIAKQPTTADDGHADPLISQAFEKAPEPLLVFEMGGELKRINRCARELLGYEESELPRLFDLIPPERRFAAKRALLMLKKKGKLSFITQVRRKSGQLMDVKVSASALGKNLFSAVCQDVADHVRIMQEKNVVEQEYRAFVSSLPYPYALFLNRKLAEKNQAFTALFPWTEGKPLSLSDFFGRRNAELLKEIGAMIENPSGDMRIMNREVLIPAPGRTTVAVEVSVARVPYAGKQALYCSFADVSARREVIDRAAAVEEKFKTLLEGSLDAISITRDGTFLLVNSAFARMFGYTDAMELIGKKLTTVVWGRNARGEMLETEQQLVAGNADAQRFEYPGKMKDGSKIVVEAHSSRITIDGKSAVLSYHRNVTEQRKAEELLDQKSRGFALLNQFINEVHSCASVDEMYHRGMNAAMKASQWETAAALVLDGTMLVLKHHHGLSEQGRLKLDRQSLDEGLARFFDKTHEALIASMADYPPYVPYKTFFESEKYTAVAFLPVIVHAQLHGMLLLATRRAILPDEQDRVLFASLGAQLSIAVQQGVLRDQAASLEERFAATVSTLSEVLYTLLPNGSFTYISPNIEALTGYKFSDFQQNPNLWRALVHPDDRPVLSRRISNQTGEATTFRLEYRVLPKGKATYIWLQDAVRYERDRTGRLDAIHGILSDITAAKLLAQSGPSPAATAAVSRTAFDVLESLPDGVALFDADLRCSEWNTALARMTGIRRDDAIGRSIHDLPPLSTILPKLIERVQAGDNDVRETLCLNVPDEKEGIAVVLRAVRRSVPDGEHSGTIVLVQEATVLRTLQQEVQETEARLRAALAAVNDAMLITDVHGNVKETNPVFTTWTGYEPEEARNASCPYPWLDSEDRERFQAWMNSLSESSATHIDVCWRHKDGRRMIVQLSASLVKDALDKPAAILIAARDITEVRHLALEVERKNKQIDLLNHIISFSNTTADVGTILRTIADEIHTLVPYEGINVSFLDEDQNLFPWYIAIPSDTGQSKQVSYLPIDLTLIYDAVRTGSPVIKEGGGDRENGNARSQISIPLFVDEKAFGAVSLISSRQRAFGPEEMAFLQPVADHIGAIIQRVRLFERVRNDSAYIHNLLNSINQIVFTVDRNYRITHVNKAWKEHMLRQNKEEWVRDNRILGKSLEVLMPDEAAWRHYKGVMDDLFAKRLESYASDIEVTENGAPATHHLVISPMVIGDTVTGLVFTQTDITEINRTEAEIKRRNTELLALNTISTSISKSLDLDEILRVAAEQVREIFDASVVAFYLQEESGHLKLMNYHGLTKELASRVEEIGAVGSLTELFGVRPKPVYIDAGGAEGNPMLQAARHVSTMLSLACTALVPLQSKEKLPGTFFIGCARQHAFSEREEQLLILIGNQIGAAIENAQLYAEIQHQVHTLTTLYELGKGLTGLLDLNAMLQVVYREVTKALPLDRFYYQAYSPENNTLSLLSRTVNGVAEFYPAGVKIRALTDWPNTIYQEVVAHGTSYMGSTSAEASDSIIAVPIKSEEKVIGIISIVASRPNVYNNGHLRLLESIANLTGVAISKAMLYEDTLKKSAELENRNKELDDFTYVVSHDLKEPLISIEGYSKIVMKDYQDRLDDEGREHLNAVVQSTARMKHLIDDLLTLSRLGRMSEAQETVSVRTIVDEILHDFQFSLRERKVQVRVQENLPHVRFSSTRLAMVFRNLISNAMKFNDKPVPTIDIGCDEDEHDFRFWVKDNGIGIEPQYFERIFGIFQRLKRSEEYRGTGAGLTIVKKIIEREGGRIWLESTPGAGSTFYFTIKKPT
jgi:PAS domain S-box-containing protein